MRAATETPPVGTTRTSRRMRRAWTALFSLLVFACLGAAAWILLRSGQEEEYAPGAGVEGITRTLDKTVDARPGQIRFTDVTAEAGLAEARSFAGERTSQLPEDMGGGVAWGDFDNDGDDDLLFVSAGGPLTARQDQLAETMLFENLGNGRFRRYAGFPPLRIRGMGAAWADFDNDGWLDAAISGYDEILLLHNRAGRFEITRLLPSRPGFWTGVSWGDFDRDGWPDLYVCGYVRYRFEAADRSRVSRQFGEAVPYTLNPSSYEAERNLLFRNLAGRGFAESAHQLGVDDPTGRSLSALWHDFDQNGWPDLYVANDISESRLFRNYGGRFENAGPKAWVNEYRGSMGLAAGDFDRDGDDDLFISHWIAQQFALYESLLSQQKLLKDAASGLHFTDVAEMRGIGQPTLRSIGWGAEFADFDSDGWPDLAVAAGSTFESGSPPRLVPMPSFLFHNDRGETFRQVADPSLPFAKPHVSRGLAVSDFDGDGDLDVAIVDLDGGLRLVRNDTRQGRALHLRLRGPKQRPWSGADGAVITAWIGRVGLRRTVSSASYLSQSTREVHIGLGDANYATRLTVRWPDGRTEEFGTVGAQAWWQIEPGGMPRLLKAAVEGKDRQLQFWQAHHDAMNLWKQSRDARAAADGFRQALALDPLHEDARYYLASALAAAGDVPGALEELAILTRQNPMSQRAFSRRAFLRAVEARTRAAMEEALRDAERAHAINPEETGALLLLGELELLLGRAGQAQRHLERVVLSNPRSVPAHFGLAWLAYRSGAPRMVKTHLEAVAAARGKDWKPPKATAEGDTVRRLHEEGSLLMAEADAWDGAAPPEAAFAKLQRRIQTLR
jgi:tetratricopeptide (TPR) repeat protein